MWRERAVREGAAVVTGPGDTDSAELARLRDEVSQLRARLDTRSRRSAALGGLRRVTAAVLVALTAFLLAAGVVGLWAARTALDTDRWVATVTPLPRNPQVAAAVSQYATTQVFEVVDVEQRLRDVLPQRAEFIAGPLTDQMREVVRRTVNTVLLSDRFQPIWAEVNRRAHQRAVAIVEGTSTVVTAQAQHVDIDLLPLINQLLRALSAQLPTLFGHTLSLPDLNSGEIPANLRQRIQDAVGISLPPNFAQFSVYDAGRLRAVQQAVVTAKRGLALLVVGTVLLLVLAFVASPRRRRTALQLGIWVVIAAVVVTACLRAIRAQLLQQVPAGTYRDGVAAAVTIVTASLRERGVQLIWIGAILAVLAYLVGPGRLPVWLRGHVVLAARTVGRWLRHAYHWLTSRGPGWIARHRDPIRIAGVVVAVGSALALSSRTALLAILVVLVAFEVAVTLTARSASTHERVRAAGVG
jgi:hypothetical protein